MLDPRRPLGAPSAEDREEGLIPYKVSAEYNPKDVASYFLQVKSKFPFYLISLIISLRTNIKLFVLKISGIQKIVSSSSHLESTSLVCAYGQDIFFTQRTPSKAFDVLSEDFSRGGLVATIVGLVIGIIVSRSMVARKKIKDSWR